MKYIKRYEGINFDDIDEEETRFNIIGHDEFLNFLEENDAFTKYMKAFKEHHNGTETLQTFLTRTPKENYFDEAFTWFDTGELGYWVKIDDRWYDSLDIEDDEDIPFIREGIDFDDIDDEEEVFTNTRGHDEFFEFLKKHDVYTSFIHNYKDYKFDDIPLQDFLDDTDPYEFIGSAFRWYRASEENSWVELDQLWRNKLMVDNDNPIDEEEFKKFIEEYK